MSRKSGGNNRFSAQRKTEAVLRLLRGEDLELVSRAYKVTAATLSQWREAFLAGGPSGLQHKEADLRDEQIQHLHSKVGEWTMAARSVGAQDRAARAWPPFSGSVIEAVSQACSMTTHRRYGLQRVCRIWQVSRSTIYAQRSTVMTSDPSPACPPAKRGPQGPCSDRELVDRIRRVLADSPFHGEGYRKVWAKLRFAGLRTSKERVRRLMREHGLQAPQRTGHPHGPKAHDGTIITEQPDLMWGTDATTTITVEQGQAYVFISVDHCTFECTGIHASASGNRFEALEPIRQGVRTRFGGYSENIADGLAMRHDHGPAYMADDFQQELDFLGIQSSPSFIREPKGNGCAERFTRLLKENLLWVRSFATIEQLRQALIEFKHLYNQQWILQRHDYKTPTQVRRDKRQTPYAEAAG